MNRVLYLIATVLMLGQASCIVLNMSGKDRCDRDRDCLDGYLCTVNGYCEVEGNAALDAGHQDADPADQRRPDGAGTDVEAQDHPPASDARPGDAGTDSGADDAGPEQDVPAVDVGTGSDAGAEGDGSRPDALHGDVRAVDAELAPGPVEGFEDGMHLHDWVVGGWAAPESQTYNRHSGARGLRFGELYHVDHRSSWIGAWIAVAAPTTVEFWLSVSAEEDDGLSFRVDGEVADGGNARWYGLHSWRQAMVQLPAGHHYIEWRYQKDGQYYGGDDTAWLDDISFGDGVQILWPEMTPASINIVPGSGQLSVNWGPVGGATHYHIYYSTEATVTRDSSKVVAEEPHWIVTGLTNGVPYVLAVTAVNSRTESPIEEVLHATPDATGAISDGFESGALDSFQWVATGDTVPTITGATSNSGSYSARFGSVGDGKQSDLLARIEVSQESTVRFAVRTNSADEDQLRFFIGDDIATDGEDTARWSRIRPWFDAGPYALPAGNYLIGWSYAKDYCCYAGDDAAWIDDIVFTEGVRIVAPGGVRVEVEDSTLSSVPNGATGDDAIEMGEQIDGAQLSFLVRNRGVEDLFLTHAGDNVVVTGDATLSDDCADQLNVFTSDWFSVQLTPGSGSKQVSISIDSNDLAANPYMFDVVATVP